MDHIFSEVGTDAWEQIEKFFERIRVRVNRYARSFLARARGILDWEIKRERERESKEKKNMGRERETKRERKRKNKESMIK